MIRVIAFGAFDPLHEGHKNFIQQAKAQGTHLAVVVARDSSIRSHKSRTPHQLQTDRLAAVAALPDVDEAILGNEGTHRYQILKERAFDVLVLGYDQQPADSVVRDELQKMGKAAVRVVRLAPFQPEQYKSTYLRK